MNHWHNRFNEEYYIYGKEPNVFLNEFQKKLNLSGNALAIAEGEGRNAVFLAEEGMNVTTWDFAESGLKKTRKLAKERRVKVSTRHIDLNDADWSQDTWDEIICIFGHFSEEIKQKTLQGVKKSIKPGGYYLTEVYSPYQIPYNSGGPKNKDFLYCPEDFLNTFSDWRIVHFFMGEVIRHEGKGHTGLAHVIQFVAQKPKE